MRKMPLESPQSASGKIVSECWIIFAILGQYGYFFCQSTKNGMILTNDIIVPRDTRRHLNQTRVSTYLTICGSGTLNQGEEIAAAEA